MMANLAEPVVARIAVWRYPSRVQGTRAIRGRFAEHPWGPWSAPVTVLEAGSPDANPPVAGSEFASGGILRHPGCVGSACAPASPAPAYVVTPYGFLYAPNIIDSWTEARGDGHEADVYWNVSTWNPYQVIVMQSKLEFAPN